MQKPSAKPEAYPSSRGSGLVRIDESYDARVERLRARTSVDGWKGPGSVRVDESTWAHALRFVEVAEGERGITVRPFISAGANGVLCMRWGMAPGPVFDVEVTSEGAFEWEEDRDDECDGGPAGCGEVLERLTRFLRPVR